MSSSRLSLLLAIHDSTSELATTTSFPGLYTCWGLKMSARWTMSPGGTWRAAAEATCGPGLAGGGGGVTGTGARDPCSWAKTCGKCTCKKNWIKTRGFVARRWNCSRDLEGHNLRPSQQRVTPTGSWQGLVHAAMAQVLVAACKAPL